MLCGPDFLTSCWSAMTHWSLAMILSCARQKKRGGCLKSGETETQYIIYIYIYILYLYSCKLQLMMILYIDIINTTMVLARQWIVCH